MSKISTHPRDIYQSGWKNLIIIRSQLFNSQECINNTPVHMETQGALITMQNKAYGENEKLWDFFVFDT